MKEKERLRNFWWTGTEKQDSDSFHLKIMFHRFSFSLYFYNFSELEKSAEALQLKLQTDVCSNIDRFTVVPVVSNGTLVVSHHNYQAK